MCDSQSRDSDSTHAAVAAFIARAPLPAVGANGVAAAPWLLAGKLYVGSPPYP